MMNEPAKQKSLDGLDARLLAWWTDMQVAYRGLDLDCEYCVIETMRSAERQTWLYGIGRTHSLGRAPVTWAKTSNHQNGRAMDIALYEDDRYLGGATKIEMDLYRHVVDLGIRVAASHHHPVHNLGRAIGRDWFHWEVTGG